MQTTGSILIVDDNPRNIQVLGATLRQEGYSLSIVTNGPDALSLLKGVHIDLILLDVMMPGMSGFDVCRELKKEPRTRDIPVIFLTALSDSEHMLEGFAVGGVDYVSKPFKSAELLARVKVHVSLRKAHQEIVRLQDILPICASCKKIRDDDGFWVQVEKYLSEHADLHFSHGICPDCIQRLYPDLVERMDRRREPGPGNDGAG
jgi:CheY-like chemotaxis protein